MTRFKLPITIMAFIGITLFAAYAIADTELQRKEFLIIGTLLILSLVILSLVKIKP